MRKSYSSLISRKFYFALLATLFLLTSAPKVTAQIDISIGTGIIGNTTTTYPCPLQDYYEGSRMQYLYLATELTAAGMGPGFINSIKYNVVTLGTAGLIEQHAMKIGGTSTATLSATAWETVTTAVFGPLDYQPIAGINTFTFPAPFFWNGTDNIVIEVCGGEPGNATGTWYTVNPVIPWTTGLAFNGSHNYRADNLGNLCGSTTTTNTGTQTTRPNITFGWVPAVACAGIPVAGTASANPTSTCLGIPFTLSLSGTTVASGITYQWESSANNIAFTDILNANSSSFTTTQIATTFYRCKVTCTSAGGGTSTTNSVQVFSPTAVSGTFTINSALPTAGINFQSFNAAYDYIKCGINGPVTFNVDAASGPYTEQLSMIPVPGASAINTVTFNGNGRTISFLSSNTNERAVIKLNGADHIKFDNLVISALGSTATEYGFGVQLLNDADSNRVSNCTININTSSTSTNFAGIVMSASATSATTTGNTFSDGNIFRSNTINGGYYGITCVGSSTAANRDNIIANNTISDFYFYGIYITGNYNTQIDSNVISRPTRTTVGTFNGIYLTSLNVSVNITRNTISNPFGGAPTSTSAFNGIYITGTDALGGFENKVINNKIYNITGLGEANAIYNSSSDNVWYQHNTILMDGTSGTALTRAFYQITLAAGIRFENNIVVISRDGSGAKYGLYHSTITSDIFSDKNDIFINPASTNAFTGFYTSARASLSDWQTGSGDDAASVASNPLFINALNGNLKPTNASIDNLGSPIGILIDITGAARSATAPDLGAYEFTPGNCIAPPTAGAASANPSTICVNRNVGLGLSGNSIGLGQTYQWQTSATIGGTYSNIGNSLNNPDSTIIASVTQYYRVAVTCSGNTSFSTPVLLTVLPALPMGVYTINAGLPTAGTNYTSFNDAKIAMNCGIAGAVVFNVVAGTGPYNEQLVLDSIAGTSVINTVTFNGNGNTIAFSPSDNLERAVIKLRTADYIRFNNLTIDATGTGTYGYGVQLFNNADSNIINNCSILVNAATTSTNYAGIVVSASETSATATGNTFCDGNIFSNNTITGGYYGITLVGSTTVTAIFNNQVTGNTISDFYQYGIYLTGNNGTLIESNNINRPTRTTVTACYGIYSTGISTNLKISKNRISNPFGAALTNTSVFGGIYLTGTDAIVGSENVISNNLIYNINGAGVQYGLYNSSSDYIRYYHNTVSLEDPNNTATTASYGFYQTILSDGIDVKNNIFSISRSGTGNKYGIYLATTGTGITSDYNSFWNTGTNAFIGYDGTNRISLSNWQISTTFDINSLSTNPFYTNVAIGNFAPLSPVIDNRGTPVGITSDILNAPRSATTPDMGAYEFSIAPCTVPPVPGVASAIPNSGICMGTKIDLKLAGYVFGSGQTYQWEYSATNSAPWIALGAPKLFPDTTIFATTSLYYRVQVSCGGNSQPSTPAQVTLNPAFLAGFYTINSTIPVSAINFTSFATAVAALDCGITGPVYFDVSANTYIEQIRMKSIAGTSPSVRVTFRSANGIPGSVILTNAGTTTANYTLKLDSASYVTYRDITIAATSTTNGRAIELANTASFDSIVNCLITVPATTLTTTTVVGIYANLLTGASNTIKGNTISNGTTGIYLNGTALTNLTYDNVIDSNIINESYNYGIYIGNNGRITTSKNIVNVTMPRSATNYGIFSTNSDSAYKYVANRINIDNVTATTSYGMYFTGCDGRIADRGRIAGNTIMALTGNTGTLYGMYQTGSTFNNTVNNVISIKTSGATSYASYSTGSGGVNFQNNTIVSTATSATTNVAAYFAQTSGTFPSINIQNNIFSHLGGGRAMYVTNLNFIYSDYNTFYTTGTSLIQWNAANNYATLKKWRDTSFWDLSSIAVLPALISTNNLRPDVSNPDVWAIHGRGNQIVGNDYDFNNNPRPTTLTTGVPDMGAFEFLPTVNPTVLTAVPAVPVAGGTQYFMYGTDTVTKITYHPTAPVPASISLQRYSGVLPTGLAAGQKSMYFYTDISVPTQGAYKYDVKQYYVNSWQGFIPTKPAIKLGRTDATNAWLVNASSKVNDITSIISDTALVYIGKFTGLTDGSVPPPAPDFYPIDSSNSGTRFWVGYGHHYGFSTNSQDMVLYLSAQAAATVLVSINGTSYQREYAIPANSAIVSVPLPKFGLVDSRITDEGKFERGIRITSDVPIQAYAHIYDGSNSGAGMLLPVGVYGYEYQSLNGAQFYPTGGAGSYSWFMVIADRDSTLVEITPVVTTKAGRPANVPFQVYLNKGEIYNVMGTINGSQGTDLSGSLIKSRPNASGNCYPIAVFSGSSRTSICGSSGDNYIQQVFPSQAWGTKYGTFSTANSTSNNQYISNIFRVMVKDVSTVVTRNGIALPQSALILPGKYYEFNTTSGTGPNGAIYVESDKPVMMAQYMVSSGGTSCPGVTAPGVGDPELIYISPLEQGIKNAVFYNTDQEAITRNYVQVVVPTAGLASTTIDGSNVFSDVFAHPYLTGYTCIRQNLSATAGQHTLISDSAFTAITYGLGSVESYGYNAGTLVKNLNGLPSFSNTLSTTGNSSYTCAKAPFKLSVLIPLKPTSILWKVSQVPGLNPNTDTLQINPVAIDSSFINNRWFYKYTLDFDYKFTTAGVFNIPISVSHPSIEGCNNTQESSLKITVLPAPTADFTGTLSACLGAPITLNGSGTTSNGVPINSYSWSFGDATTASGQNATKTYTVPGTYNVKLSIIAQDGCVGDTSKAVVINPIPVVSVVLDSQVVCGNGSVTFNVQNPIAGTIYNWYNQSTGGTSLFTGANFTATNITGFVTYYVEPTSANSCIGLRKRVIANVLPDLAIPIVVVDSVGVDRVTFKWNAVPNAVSYQVAINGSTNWITPSSGSAGLSHIVTGLLPLTNVSLKVRAQGLVSCQESISTPALAKTLTDQIYIPNAFTPNGDAVNDVLLVYGYAIQSMRFSVYNQWGEKIFESTNQSVGWNGTHNGKLQPSGVYMYVCQLTLRDGTTLLKKGSINLVR